MATSKDSPTKPPDPPPTSSADEEDVSPNQKIKVSGRTIDYAQSILSNKGNTFDLSNYLAQLSACLSSQTFKKENRIKLLTDTQLFVRAFESLVRHGCIAASELRKLSEKHNQQSAELEATGLELYERTTLLQELTAQLESTNSVGGQKTQASAQTQTSMQHQQPRQAKRKKQRPTQQHMAEQHVLQQSESPNATQLPPDNAWSEVSRKRRQQKARSAVDGQRKSSIAATQKKISAAEKKSQPRNNG